MKTKMLGLLAVGLLAGPMAANAVPMRLTATPVPLWGGVLSDFTVDFDDMGDGLFSLGEMTSFSGTWLGGYTSFFPTLSGVPTITGFTSGNDTVWRFSAPGKSDASFASQAYTYVLSRTSTVPEPGTLALLGLGLAGLGLSRRRKV